MENGLQWLWIVSLSIGKTYTTDTLNTLTADLNPAMVATPDITASTTAFFHPASPLSNFHRAEIEIDRKKYAHVEQHYQKEKAVSANDPDIALKIMQTSVPFRCYTLGKSTGIDLAKWHENVALQVMKKACLAKFTQHKQLQTFLLNPGDIHDLGPYWKYTHVMVSGVQACLCVILSSKTKLNGRGKTTWAKSLLKSGLH